MERVEKVLLDRISGHHREVRSDAVISETEVVLEVNGEPYCTLHCLPSQLEELAGGHLVSAGTCGFCDIKRIEVKRDGSKFVVIATIDKGNSMRMKGVSLQAKITVAEIWDAMQKLDENSILFRKTGGTHVVGIYEGGKSIFAEDISRDCAVDKAIWLAFQSGMGLATSTLLTTGRQTASTVEKAAWAQIPVIVGISAPTSRAIETAQKFDITLIGFARGHSFNIYSHKWRVIDNE
jgi:FdhD protein